MHSAPLLYYKRQKTTGLAEEELVSVSTRMILQESEKYGIVWKEIPETRVFEMTFHGQTKYFHAQIPAQTTWVGFHACLDKNVTKGFLRAAGIQTPKGFHLTRFDSQSYWKEVFESVKKPLVVKPTHSNQGRGVFMNITQYEEYEKAVQKAFEIVNDDRAGVIVEETFEGTEYRVLATPKKVIGIINRVPANVVGDGTSTIAQLIAVKNSDPRRSDLLDEVLIKIKVDEHVLAHLASQNLTVESVPQKDQQIFLRLNSNISTGGDSLDVTDIAHPTVKDIAVRTMQALPGLEFAGIDFMTKDITKPQDATSYTIVEANSSPGFCIHDFPYLGENRHAAREFLFIMFPELEQLPLPA